MATGSVSQFEEERIVMSDLPLLFADGYPCSLDSLSVRQLELFIPFMLDCSLNRESSCKELQTSPPWWPVDVKFQIPLVRPAIEEQKWCLLLKKVVNLCYRYHNAAFMLAFCNTLSKTPHSALKFVDLLDGTTSLLKRDSGKLLVTFKNENLTYDRKVVSPRRSLLPPREPRKPVKVQSLCLDIYLCDNCDSEFETLQDIRIHESGCSSKKRTNKQLTKNASSPLRLSPSKSENCASTAQARYLKNLGLTVDHVIKKVPPPVAVRGRGRTGLLRYNVPLSSPLGRKLMTRNSVATAEMHAASLETMEQWCNTGDVDMDNSCLGEGESEDEDNSKWSHQYLFSRRQREERKLTLETGLSPQSRKYLRSCKPVSILLTRLGDVSNPSDNTEACCSTAPCWKEQEQPIVTTAKSAKTLGHDREVPQSTIAPMDDEVHGKEEVNVENSEGSVPANKIIRKKKLFELFYSVKPPTEESARPTYNIYSREAVTLPGMVPSYKELFFLRKTNVEPTRENLEAIVKWAMEDFRIRSEAKMELKPETEGKALVGKATAKVTPTIFVSNHGRQSVEKSALVRTPICTPSLSNIVSCPKVGISDELFKSSKPGQALRATAMVLPTIQATPMASYGSLRDNFSSSLCCKNVEKFPAITENVLKINTTNNRKHLSDAAEISATSSTDEKVIDLVNLSSDEDEATDSACLREYTSDDSCRSSPKRSWLFEHRQPILPSDDDEVVGDWL